jgi:hypothetical protein
MSKSFFFFLNEEKQRIMRNIFEKRKLILVPYTGARIPRFEIQKEADACRKNR